MSNRGFLSTSNLAALYPGMRGKDDIEHEVIAASVNCVPALWLAFIINGIVVDAHLLTADPAI